MVADQGRATGHPAPPDAEKGPISAQLRLSSAHNEYRWIEPAEAEGLLTFDHQARTIEMIEAKFVRRTPPEFLRVKSSAGLVQQ